MTLSHSKIQELINIWDTNRTVTNTSFVDEGIETIAKVEFEDHTPVMLKTHYTDRYTSSRTFLADPHSMRKLRECDQTTIPTPEIYYISDEMPTKLDVPYYIMEYLPDRTGSEVSNTNAVQYFSDLGKYVGQLHSIPLQTESPLYGWAGYIDGEIQPFPDDNYETLESFIISELETYRDRIQNQDRFSEQISEYATEVLDYLSKTSILENRPKRYCHRDIKEANTFINNTGKVTGIIDWSPIIADPAYEFASIQLRLLESNEDPYPYADTKDKQQQLISAYQNSYYTYGPLEEPVDKTLFLFYKTVVVLRTLGSFKNWFSDFSESTKNEGQEYYESKLHTLLPTFR